MWWQYPRRFWLHARHILLVLVSSSVILVASLTMSLAQETTPSALTEVELQSELMSFSDRLYMFLGQAAGAPAFRANSRLFGDQAAIVIAAQTIAGGPNPAVGLLDMVVLVTLERMIYESHWRQQFGDLVQPTIAALRLLEVDIGRIAAKVLTPSQRQELHNLIDTWRRKYPKQVAVSFMRFSDFAKDRQVFTLAEGEKAHGLFKSVQEATQTVDEIRLLAERGIFLATRVPLLLGAMSEIFVSRWMDRPELVQLRGNIDQFSEAMDRAVVQVEQLPQHVQKERAAAIMQLMDRVEVERQATINHIMDRVAMERQQLMQALVTDEETGHGVLSELQQTLTAGSKLATSAQGVVQALDHFTSQAYARKLAAGKKPGDISDIRGLIVDATAAFQHFQGLAETLNQLLLSPGWEQRLPQLLQVLDRTGREGEDFVRFTVHRALISGLIFLIAFLLAIVLAGLVLIPYAAKRFSRAPAPQGTP